MDKRPHLRVADVFRSGWKEYDGAHRVPRWAAACTAATAAAHRRRCTIPAATGTARPARPCASSAGWSSAARKCCLFHTSTWCSRSRTP